MQVTICLVAVASTKAQGRIEVPVVRVTSHGRTHDDMDRMLEYLCRESPLTRYGVSRTESTITFRVRLTALKPRMIRDFRKLARNALTLEAHTI